MTELNSQTGPRVLIVDDDPAMIRLLTKWLEAAGYRVRGAGDGLEAAKSIGQVCPDLILLDWEMPRLNGPELCRWVRSLGARPYVFVVFLTNRAGSDDVLQGLASGADDYLKKPVDRTDLLVRLHAGARALERERRLSRLEGQVQRLADEPALPCGGAI